MKVARGTLTLRRADGRVVCESVGVADSTLRRMRGLLGRRSLPAGQGIVLRPAWSIHTAFMHFPIDVVFVDQDQVVIRIANRLGPFRTASCRGAREVIELAAGECETRGLEVGDRIAWAAQAQTEGLEGLEGLGPGTTAPQMPARGRVAVVSPDKRFGRLSQFLLEQRGVESERFESNDVVAALEEDGIDGVLLDAEDDLAGALRLTAAVQAKYSGLPVVVVGGGAADRAPQGLVVYAKWDQTAEAIDDLAGQMRASGQ